MNKMIMKEPFIADLIRDAEQLLIEDISLHILDLALEDAPKSTDIHLLTEEVDHEEDTWTGYFQSYTNMEQIYEVVYKYKEEKFFITTYLMTRCKKVDPPHKYDV